MKHSRRRWPLRMLVGMDTARRKSRRAALLVTLGLAGAGFLAAQVETVPSPPQEYVWVGEGRVEGHLALNDSPAGAFSPDGKSLAIVIGGRIFLQGLNLGASPVILHPAIAGLENLDIQSANFIAPDNLFLLAKGTVRGKGGGRQTPLLAFVWDAQKDALTGKVDEVGAGGGFSAILYFPTIRYLGMEKKDSFVLWSPAGGRSFEVKVAELTHPANLFTVSPDGHWLLLAQIQGNGSADPVVVRLKDDTMVDTLRGHQSDVLSLSFSRDSSKVVTASEDGIVRIYSAPGWKLVATLAGHHGPVHWAEFSPDGRWVVSAGDDRTVRVWSAADGKLAQTLREPDAAVRTAAFSPDGRFIAASTDHSVYYWMKSPTE